eukprot:364903-Chlamydomonas_euryale.AAC.8
MQAAKWIRLRVHRYVRPPLQAYKHAAGQHQQQLQRKQSLSLPFPPPHLFHTWRPVFAASTQKQLQRQQSKASPSLPCPHTYSTPGSWRAQPAPEAAAAQAEQGLSLPSAPPHLFHTWQPACAASTRSSCSDA